jgi:hypothetical protein
MLLFLKSATWHKKQQASDQVRTPKRAQVWVGILSKPLGIDFDETIIVGVPSQVSTGGILRFFFFHWLFAQVRAVEFWRQNEETGTTELVFRVGCDSPSTIDMRQRQDLLSGAGGFGWPVPQTGVTLFQIYYLAGFMNYVYNVHIYI